MYIRDEYSSTINAISFIYSLSSLFDKISLISQYRAKNIKDGEGKALIDELAITEDEEDAVKLFLEKSIHDCFTDVVKMSRGIADSLLVNQTATLGSSSTVYTHQYGFSIRDREAYNANVLELVDEGIENYLVYSVLVQWYKLNRMTDDEAAIKSYFDQIRIDLINRRLFQLRKPLISQ